VVCLIITIYDFYIIFDCLELFHCFVCFGFDCPICHTVASIMALLVVENSDEIIHH